MKVSAIKIGNKFKYNGVEYVKTNHNRGIYFINGESFYKTFNKSKDVIETEKKKSKRVRTYKVYKG